MQDTVKKDPAVDVEAEKRARPFRSSLLSWIASDEQQLERAERLLLRPIEGHFEQLTAAGINTIRSPQSSTDHTKPTLLLLHGFGAGLGCWVQNWIPLCKVANVYAIDLPGMGRSVRDDYEFKTAAEVIDHFVAYMDAWLEAVHLDQTPLIVAGHSFGAYLGSHYAVRRPGRFMHLIMCDPWGVAEMPANIAESLTLKWKLFFTVIYKVSPMALIRAAGPWGHTLLRRARPDFARRWIGVLDDPRVFYDYTYHCNARLPPTGEWALRACSQGPAYARIPLIQFLPRTLSTDVAVTVIHGQHTWMDVSAYFEFVELLRPNRSLTSLHTIHGAGHQLNTDDATTFNELVVNAVLESPVKSRLLSSSSAAAE